MDPKVVIEKNYVMRDFAGVRVAVCNSCKKEIVLRSGSLAITRLISHVGQHGLLFGEALPTASQLAHSSVKK